MDEIYLKVLSLLKAVDGLKYIDLNYGQLLVERPTVAFPCALVDIAYTNCEYLTAELMRVKCRVSVTVGINVSVDKTASIYTDAANQNSLVYFALINAAFVALQGYTDGEIEPLALAKMTQELTVPGYKVTELPFDTEFDLVVAA